jgi:hypothetical protein
MRGAAACSEAGDAGAGTAAQRWCADAAFPAASPVAGMSLA